MTNVHAQILIQGSLSKVVVPILHCPTTGIEALTEAVVCRISMFEFLKRYSSH